MLIRCLEELGLHKKSITLHTHLAVEEAKGFSSVLVVSGKAGVALAQCVKETRDCLHEL